MFSITDSTILIGDARKILKNVPDNFFQSIITSPPYWHARDYNNSNQIGIEPTLNLYLTELVLVFNQLYRVLKKNGTLWLNIGDMYTSGNRKYRAIDKKNKNRSMEQRPKTPDGLKSKELIGIPWRLVFELQANSWYLRSEIIWSKSNPMPESVKDRPSKSHEHLFLFTKSPKYFFNKENLVINKKEFNKTVWVLPVNGKRRNHKAVFPEKLIQPCILSSSIENDFILDPFFGSGTVGIVAQKFNRNFVGIELNSDYIFSNIKNFKSLPKLHSLYDLL